MRTSPHPHEVLPILPVNFVTYLAGCSARLLSGPRRFMLKANCHTGIDRLEQRCVDELCGIGLPRTLPQKPTSDQNVARGDGIESEGIPGKECGGRPSTAVAAVNRGSGLPPGVPIQHSQCTVRMIEARDGVATWSRNGTAVCVIKRARARCQVDGRPVNPRRRLRARTACRDQNERYG